MNKTLLVSVILLSSLKAYGAEFKSDDGTTTKVTGVITLGTQIRMENPSPDAYADLAAKSVPAVPPGKLKGYTGGSDLNYPKHREIATVLRGVVNVDVKKGDFGFFIRGSAWKDFVNGEKAVAYGNYPNWFVSDSPLSDKGFFSGSKFTGYQILDYYFSGKFNLTADRSIDARLGRQVLQWGGSQILGGGINAAINPIDYSSQFRPGAQPFDGKLPIGMFSMHVNTASLWGVDAFLAYEARGMIVPGCGTYFDTAAYIPQGCDFVSVSGASEKNLLALGAYVHRLPNVKPKQFGNFGVAVERKFPEVNTDLKLYFMKSNSMIPALRTTVRSLTYGVRAVDYAISYAEDVYLYGMSFTKKIDDSAKIFGELAYRPKQAINFNASDLIAGFVMRSASSILALNKNILSIPVGGSMDAYDRYGVVTGSLGASKSFTGALKAEKINILGEIGFSHVNNLPNPDVIRYGRSFAYSIAGYKGEPAACVDVVVGKTCSSDGYVSTNSWGLRMLGTASYPNVFNQAKLTLSLLVAKDIKGWSYDGTFSEGRFTMRPGVRLDWKNGFYADVNYTLFSGGKYNLLIDRDYLSLVLGMRF